MFLNVFYRQKSVARGACGDVLEVSDGQRGGRAQTLGTAALGLTGFLPLDTRVSAGASLPQVCGYSITSWAAWSSARSPSGRHQAAREGAEPTAALAAFSAALMHLLGAPLGAHLELKARPLPGGG